MFVAGREVPPDEPVQEQPTHRVNIMNGELLYVGLDVHAESIAAAVAGAGREGEARNYGAVSGGLHAVEKLLRRLGHPRKELRVCHEAGPCGFVLARRLKQLGTACAAAATSSSQQPSGPSAAGGAQGASPRGAGGVLALPEPSV